MQRLLQGKIFFYLVLALAPLLSLSGRASERFPRPVFTHERKFVVSTSQEASVLKDPEIPFEIVFFDRASQSCQLNHPEVLGKLRTIFSAKSGLWRSLDRLFPNSRKRLVDRQVLIFIDDFTEFAGQRPDFTSYFVNVENHPIVGLSCSTLLRSYWLPSLAHEFTHALFDGTHTESWWEEGLAQNIEADIGGRQPSLTLKHLHSFPKLLENRRPLPSKESYAINQLFVQYLMRQFGGWPLLKAMSASGEEKAPLPCESENDFLAKIACRGKLFLESSGIGMIPHGKSLGADKMTRAGLLRYFAVALTLNDYNISKYNISGWTEMPLPQRPLFRVLEPGQFMAWKNSQTLIDINPKLEFYRVLADMEGHFIILPKSQVADVQALARAKEKLNSVQKDFFLLLNLGLSPEPLFKQNQSLH